MTPPDPVSFLAEAGLTLASSLDYSVTLQRVTDLAVPDMADFCIVELTRDGGITGLAVTHVDPDAADALREARRRFPPGIDQSTPGATALRTGRPQLLVDIDDSQLARAIAEPEHRALIARLGARSILTVPMMARGRVVGVLSLGFAGSGRRFGPADIPLAEDLAARVAAAVDSALLYEEAQAALGDQERARALLDAVVWSAPVGLAFFDTDLRYLKVNGALAEINGLSVEEHTGRRVDELLSGISAHVTEDLLRVRTTGQAIIDREVEGETPALPGVHRTWIHSYYPVFSAAGELFALGAVVVEITERKRLLEAERRARADAERANARLAFLAEASRILASSLQAEDMLGDLARLIVPELAETCSVYLVEGEELALVATAHRLAGRREVPGAWEATAEGEGALREVARTGVSLLPADAGPSLAVPMTGPNGVVGVLALTAAPTDTRFGPADVSLMEDLARRAGGAIDNIMVMRERNRVLHLLQQSLLPPRTPDLPGMEVAVRYHPVGDGSEVGGDFYDIFPLEPGVYGVVIGDVGGKGVTAASLTALARYTVRSAARHGRSPSEVLDFLNATIIDAELGEQFCTMAYAAVRPEPGGAHVTIACGGHPLPFRLPAGGGLEQVGVAGRAVGMLPDADTTEVSVRLGAGDTLILYTDGLLEVRSPEGAFAPDLLSRTLQACAGLTAEALAAALDAALMHYQGGRARDDMAMVVLRVPPAGPGEAGREGGPAAGD